MSMAFPSLPGVRQGWFPRLTGTTKRSDSPSPVAPSFVAFARRYHRCARPSPPTAPGTRPRIIPELGQPVIPPRHGRRSRWDLPSSRGTLLVVRPVLRPRSDQTAPWGPRVGQPDAAPALDKDEGSVRGDFGAQWHGVRPRCPRFAVAITRPQVRLASGGWLSFAEWDWQPAGFQREVSSQGNPPLPSFLTQCLSPFWRPTFASRPATASLLDRIANWKTRVILAPSSLWRFAILGESDEPLDAKATPISPSPSQAGLRRGKISLRWLRPIVG